MSERTAPSLARLDALLPTLRALPPNETRDRLVEETEALRRAVAAFHMEGIRFRMHSVDRLLHAVTSEEARTQFEQVRHELETAGFHTRSHAAP
jgi:hypothetical protein